MIKGKAKPTFDEFETVMDALLGNHSDGHSTTYYFEILRDTFARAAKALELDAKSFHESLKGEDLDVKQSIIQSQESTAYPLLRTLYNSYFITLHSELESIWSQTVKEFNNFNQQTIKKPNLHSNYFNVNITSNLSNFLDNAVTKHKILFTYNYIRNGLVHPKNDKACNDYQILCDLIAQHKITDVEIVESGEGFNFSIKSLAFGEKYASEILSFIQTIIDESIQQKHSTV